MCIRDRYSNKESAHIYPDELSTSDIRNNLEKGHIFAKSFEEKLRIEDPYLRKTELMKTIDNIRKWLGV